MLILTDYYLQSSRGKNTVFENPSKVLFNIASEASYVYILSGPQLIEKYQKCPFWKVFGNLNLSVKQCYRDKNW